MLSALLLLTAVLTRDTSAAGLLQDVVVFEKTYRALHPGLLRYNTPEQLDRHFENLKKQWSRDQSLREAYLSLSEFLGKIKCGHTYANFFNQSEVVANQLFNDSDKVPFTFRWLNRHMVATKDFSASHSFPVGTEILAIDNVKTEDILKRLMAVARADGSNDPKRVADMEVLGNSKYEAFDIFYPLYYPARSKSRSYLVRTPKSSGPSTIAAESIKSSARLSPSSDDPAAAVWTLMNLSPTTAYLKMPTWAMYNRKWDWKKFLNSSLDSVTTRAVPNLVIDLRGNEGGDSVGDLILARFIKEKTATEDFQRYTRYRTVPADLRANLSTWDKSFYDWGAAAQPAENGFFRLSRYDDGKGSIVEPSPTPYRGKVYVIIGPENSSATFEFALQMKRLKLGTLVGKTTGGSQQGINGGAFFFLRLPHSGLEVDVPLIAQFFPGRRPDTGVAPDVTVTTTASDVASGRDTELARVLQLIGEKS